MSNLLKLQEDYVWTLYNAVDEIFSVKTVINFTHEGSFDSLVFRSCKLNEDLEINGKVFPKGCDIEEYVIPYVVKNNIYKHYATDEDDEESIKYHLHNELTEDCTDYIHEKMFEKYIFN